MPAPTKPATRYGRALRQLRIKGGYSQTTLARRIGAAQPSVSEWERGDALPSPATHKRLVRVLGITDDLYIAEVMSRRRTCNGYTQGDQQTSPDQVGEKSTLAVAA